ncbi:MAG TPA: glycosyltransferase family 2 protein [Marinilabiliales bacterium]|nr:MAG: glycosyl transferase family 2 [Bacteroidetes bacterium GWC2_40_13]OFX72926.1 MAG: glycosyl transferase family 2 [Bacteroidetes bacterium GWD2_40_43]OFX91541.1 MAG: glycosyl transferase family 2 [Bacteroidetes bacterium GWE2_40_63]OFY19702.1 MAG: glycosyl transferase family 2 [Bacteroidetes bacterium GWF2_40_13]OFZ25456.1 MAG: glycosyl transferase family 2 [Bacteroidetes bacterium RIFOXYC2_FULL_40_12]HAB50946.1 glycosyltransferase family 2 protein [Ignavibacteriales bacterium]HAN00414.
MLNNKSIAVVIPAYNEESQIGMVIETISGFVDRIIIVNDFSKDKTSEIVKSYQGKFFANLPETKSKTVKSIYSKADEIVEEWNRKELNYFAPAQIIHPADNDKIVLINLLKNSGVGGAIARGYKWAKDNQIDCTAVMAGDGQMDPDELEGICRPVIDESADYVKGNRLSHKSAKALIPKTRFFGNSVLSILTKLASGYWHVSDTQTGYTAISNKALNLLELYKIYPRYGMPNDMLVKLNIENCTLKEIPIKPIYHVGEKSKMKIRKVIPRVSWLLIKSFFNRIWTKYFFRSFHPLFILYHLGLLLTIVSIPYGIKILSYMIQGIDANPVTVLGFMFLFISGFQSILFAMWMDIQDNERLNI